MKTKIWEMLENPGGTSKAGKVYGIFMPIVIVASLVPLLFKKTTPLLVWIDYITVAIFIIDYALRWITAGIKLKKGRKSFGLYPVTPMAIIDLVSILPSLTIITSAFRLLKMVRLFRTLRVLRSLRLLRRTKNIRIIIEVIRDEWTALITVLVLALGYVVIVALVVFNLEPNIFDNFMTAIYWSTITLTTVGYGDIVPVTAAGQAITVISTFVGIAVIALPSGVIAGGFMEELRKERREGTEGTDSRADILSRIEGLAELKERGIIDESEFTGKKADLLSRL